jgi:hypothetical protein
MKHPLIRQLDLLSTDRWARQGLRAILRSLWLSLCVWCIVLGGHLVWGWPLRYDLLGLAALALVGGAVLLVLLRRRMPPREVARRLDRRFHLDEQIATALELTGRPPEPDSIGARLLSESTRTLGQVRRRIERQQAQPWSEVIALLAMTLIMIGLLVMSGIGRVLPGDTALEPLPPLVQAEGQPEQADQPQQPPGAAPDPAGRQQAAASPSDLAALADALRGQGATRPAAEALDRGDTAGAAQSLRELADQADQLSSQARRDLADRLRDAADAVQGRDPGLAQQLRDSADALERGGAEARQGLEDLADSIEQLGQGQQAGDNSRQQGQDGQQGQQGQQGQDGQQGQQSGTNPGSPSNSAGGEQRQAGTPNRLGVEGQPLALDAEGGGQPADRQTNRPPTSVGTGAGGTPRNSGTPSGSACANCADPLRVPADERDVVQDYFSP